MSGGLDWGALARWIWRSQSPWASLSRLALLPPAALYRLGVLVRNVAYDAGALTAQPLPLPSVGVGNLVVGGVGKTPFASFLAAELVRRGVKPGILLRGYGADEEREHAAAVSLAVVVVNPDRRAAAERAARSGARALVLDDCLQRRDVVADLMLAMVSAESTAPPRWPLPAGPWREGLGALGRADAVVVSHKTAAAADAAALGARLAPRTRLGAACAVELAVGEFRPIRGGPAMGTAAVAGRSVVAVCGIGAPELFAAQLGRLGARVRLLAFGDHHDYRSSDVQAARSLAGEGGLVVTTAKDAVKLAPLWLDAAPSCWVATLVARMTAGGEMLSRLLDRVATAARSTPRPGEAEAPPSGVS
ncbi:MAG: tetraacyldisaccharide 4'-kinase [Gemmatimonadetes bacterium]|nr:tetraacyldisaccharide 4'-kinase [Gemmatimonadota bacterium]